MNNQLTTIEQKAPATMQQQTFSLAPRNMAEAIEFAKMMANSDFVPKDCKGKPGNILAAVQFGTELGLAPMQAMQNIAVINGRPCLWGDAMQGLVQASGLLEDMKEWDDGTTAFCKVKRKGFSEPHTVSFSNDDAKRAGLLGKPGPWTQYPERMRRMRARAFALRDQFADVLRGINSAEEVSDYTTAKISDLTNEHRNEPIIEAIEQPSEESPAIISRFLSLNEKISEEWGEDTYKHFLKNSKGESPSINQIKTWRLPKQLALLRTACDKIEQQFKDEFAKVDARKEELKAQAKMLEESESEMVSEIIKTMDAEVVNG